MIFVSNSDTSFDNFDFEKKWKNNQTDKIWPLNSWIKMKSWMAVWTIMVDRTWMVCPMAEWYYLEEGLAFSQNHHLPDFKNFEILRSVYMK